MLRSKSFRRAIAALALFVGVSGVALSVNTNQAEASMRFGDDGRVSQNEVDFGNVVYRPGEWKYVIGRDIPKAVIDAVEVHLGKPFCKIEIAPGVWETNLKICLPGHGRIKDDVTGELFPRSDTGEPIYDLGQNRHYNMPAVQSDVRIGRLLDRAHRQIIGSKPQHPRQASLFQVLGFTSAKASAGPVRVVPAWRTAEVRVADAQPRRREAVASVRTAPPAKPRVLRSSRSGYEKDFREINAANVALGDVVKFQRNGQAYDGMWVVGDDGERAFIHKAVGWDMVLYFDAMDSKFREYKQNYTLAQPAPVSLSAPVVSDLLTPLASVGPEREEFAVANHPVVAVGASVDIQDVEMTFTRRHMKGADGQSVLVDIEKRDDAKPPLVYLVQQNDGMEIYVQQMDKIELLPLTSPAAALRGTNAPEPQAAPAFNVAGLTHDIREVGPSLASNDDYEAWSDGGQRYVRMMLADKTVVDVAPDWENKRTGLPMVFRLAVKDQKLRYKTVLSGDQNAEVASRMRQIKAAARTPAAA